jgi:broad specificity phosphatase PhoE
MLLLKRLRILEAPKKGAFFMPQDTTSTELYFIRHAETVMNTNTHLVGGRSNETPLTPRGIEQAKTLGRTMFSKGIIPTKVFASPALRTIDTARYSLIEMGLDVEPLIHDAIQELSQGLAEGKPRAEVYTETVKQDIDRLGKEFKLEGGESMNDVGLRMSGWLSETFTNTANELSEKYFIYTHGGAIKYLASHVLDLSHKQTYEMKIENASVNLFTLQNGVCNVAYLNKQA